MSSNKSSWYMKGGQSYNNQGRKPPWFRKNSKAPSTSGSTSSNKSRLIKYVVEMQRAPYIGWRLYFLEEAYTEGSTTHRKINHFEEFIQRHLHLFSLDKIEENQAFTLDLTVVTKDDSFTSVWPNFLDELTTTAEHTLSCLGLAMHQTIVQARQKLESTDQEIEPSELRKINARITNHEPILHLKNLKVNYFGKLVSVRGTVIRVSDVKLICRWMAFECGSCRGKQVLKQPDGVYTMPTRCDTRGCKAQTRFTPVLSLPHTRTDDWQVLKLQELIGTDQCEGGRIPRIVECELTDDLVNSCGPGDDVTITGIIKVRNREETGTKNKQASIFLLYMDAVSVVNNKNQLQASHGAAGIEFNLVDYYAIQKIHAEPSLLKLLVHSLCPAIYGHEMIKAGLILSLFGGTECGPGTRADPHILMVGDPGLGKSQMLQACSNVAPRGVFVCGNTSTSSGLTVTMTRESGGEYSLEAGALILADQGCCCIDEFDKMPTQHAALLEAMEQQTVSIAKAGVVSSLPARTTILAAANPVGGHYNKAKTVSENLRIDGALLSRFDLVFILRDKPNQLLDSLLSEHVLALHVGIKQKKSGAQSICSDAVSIASDEYVPLQENLKLLKGEEIDVLPHQLLRKYIAYARKYVHPSLSPEAANVLKKFYLELRKRHLTSDGTPVTTRQSQSLTRLTLARAKVELREIATERDALDVVEIVKYSLVDTFSDEYDKLDFKRSHNGSGMSQRNKVKVLVSVLQRIAEVESRSEFTITELRQAAQNGGVGDDFYNLLNTLNLHGYLLKKDSNTYKLLSVD